MSEKPLFHAWFISTIWLFSTDNWLGGTISTFVIVCALLYSAKS